MRRFSSMLIILSFFCVNETVLTVHDYERIILISCSKEHFSLSAGYGIIQFLYGGRSFISIVLIIIFIRYRDFLLNDTRLDDLQRWGLNVVRLGSMWAGAEPARGEYNLTYINTLQVGAYV